MLKWINKKRNKKGFTLVELVVVIAILGVLAAIAVPKMGKSRENAKIATHDTNVRILKSAASMYIADNPNSAAVEANALKIELEKDYLDGGYPIPPKGVKGIDATEYQVSIDANGNILVVPGEYTPPETTETTETP